MFQSRLLHGLKRLRREISRLSREYASVSRVLNILRSDIAEKELVVAYPRPHPVCGRVPPVHYIPFLILMSGAIEQHFSRAFPIGIHHGKTILQLISESYRSARLIESATTVHARRYHLIHQPIVNKHIHLGLVRLNR